MSLISELSKLINAWGMDNLMKDRSKSKYKPLYGGQWVNKGTFIDEKWDWEEDKNAIKMRTMYVCTIVVEGGVILAVSNKPTELSMKCDNEEEVQDAIAVLSAKYRCRGIVTISREEIE
jgi:hypothetical protein